MGAVDRDPAYYYERICGPQDTFNRTVNGNNFFIVFTSYEGHVDDSKITMDRQFVGFHALYEFTNNTVSNAKRTTASGMKIMLLDKCAVFPEVGFSNFNCTTTDQYVKLHVLKIMKV